MKYEVAAHESGRAFDLTNFMDDDYVMDHVARADIASGEPGCTDGSS